VLDLTVAIGTRFLTNPIGVASGTFGYGSEYEKLIDFNRIGALFTKAVTPEPRAGNDVPRIVETPSGMLNSIGLANVGLQRFISEKLPFLSTVPSAVVVNVAGADEGDYRTVVETLAGEEAVWGWEINLSCPNVACGGLALGTNPKQVRALTAELRVLTDKPLIVKLTPNVTDITEIALAAEDGGADAVTCINTLVGMLIDTASRRSVLPGGTGGLSGPAILPVGLAAVYRVSRTVSIPVIGVGGIIEPDHALQYLLAGASAVQVGTANFIDPGIHQRILEAIERYAERHSLRSVAEFRELLE